MCRWSLTGAREKGRGVTGKGQGMAGALLFLYVVSGFPGAVGAQTMESVTLDEAVQRALKNNPTIGQVAQGVLRAESLLQQARAATLPNVNATFSNVVVDTERGFNGAITQPRSQSAFSATLGVPVLALSQWAATTQARDQIEIANLSTADVRTEIAVATAQAYLAIIAQKRQVEVSMRARETALSHLDYARRRLEAGAGTKSTSCAPARKWRPTRRASRTRSLASAARRKRSAS